MNEERDLQALIAELEDEQRAAWREELAATLRRLREDCERRLRRLPAAQRARYEAQVRDLLLRVLYGECHLCKRPGHPEALCSCWN